jgi:hypothetical protein
LFFKKFVLYPTQTKIKKQYKMKRLSPGQTVCGYKIGEKIGKGSFGSVVRATKDGEDFALKSVCITDVDASQAFEEYGFCGPFEVDVQSRAHHPNIIPLVEVLTPRNCPELDHIILVTPLFESSLNRSAVRKHFDTREKRMRGIYQILSALDFLENNGIVHKDISPDNILVDSKGNLYVSDFGSVGPVREDYVEDYSSFIFDTFLTGEVDKEMEEIANELESNKSAKDVIASFPVFRQFPLIVGEYDQIAQENKIAPKLILCLISYITSLLYDENYGTTVFFILFLAVDLLYRCSDLLSHDPHTMYITFACYHMALNMERETEIDRSVPLEDVIDQVSNKIRYELDPVVLRETELEVAEYLNYKLYRPYIFAHCKTLEQVRDAYFEIVLNPEIYLGIDLNKWFDDHPPSFGTLISYSRIEKQNLASIMREGELRECRY